MRLSLIKVTAAAAAVLVVIAGCSDKQNGTARPGPTVGNTDQTDPQEPTSTAAPTSGAPKVTSPLDAGKFLTQPCAVLTAAQLKDFNISRPGEPDTDSTIAKSTGPICNWFSDDQPVTTGYDVAFLTANKNGLSDTYRGGKEHFEGYFEPTEVDGYPAVFNDLSDGRPSGACNITVGISDTLAFRAAVQASEERGAKSCDDVKRLATAVIQTVKGA